MASAMIPAVHLKGVYTVADPFKIEENVIYECSAAIVFGDLYQQGVDVYSTYYKPYDLSQAKFNTDSQAGEAIVTLKSPGLASVTLPSSFIVGFPTETMVPYNLFILSANIVAADDQGFDPLIESMQACIEENYGVKDAVVTVTQTPTTSYMTVEDAKVAEANRQEAISNTETLRAENKRQADQIQAMQLEIAALTQALIDASTDEGTDDPDAE